MSNTRARSFYNTIGIKGKELEDAESKAEAQTKMIYEFLKANKDTDWTSYEIWCLMPWMLISSVRRSLTNLKKDNKVIKTGLKRPGGYGSPNDIWEYKIKDDEK